MWLKRVGIHSKLAARLDSVLALEMWKTQGGGSWILPSRFQRCWGQATCGHTGVPNQRPQKLIRWNSENKYLAWHTSVIGRGRIRLELSWKPSSWVVTLHSFKGAVQVFKGEKPLVVLPSWKAYEPQWPLDQQDIHTSAVVSVLSWV